MPRYLHRQLAEVARDQGVSLNQFVCTAAVMAAGINGLVSDPPATPSRNRTTDEEFSRIWRETFC
jgi:hypothetical protein